MYKKSLRLFLFMLVFCLTLLTGISCKAYAEEYNSYVGKLNISAYSDNLKTFYGEKPVSGRTVSAKLSMFDMGESIKIGDKVYKVESTLAESASENIMVYCDSREAAVKYGMKTEKVYRKSGGAKAAAKNTSASKSASAGKSKSASASSQKAASSSKAASTHIAGKSLGKFQVTAYCSCAICSGQYAGGATSSGVMPKQSHTIAVDPAVIPMGSKVVIDGVIYTAEDTGKGIDGKKIDIYFNDHAQAQAYGLKTKEVFATN